jgi:hypothetical protein
MPLYGHELSRELKPVQVGLERVVDMSKDSFVGREGVMAGVSAGATRLVGIASEGKRAGRADYPVHVNGRTIGVITSGALSPTLGHPIAFALVEPDFAEIGTSLEIDVRGTALSFCVPAGIVTAAAVLALDLTIRVNGTWTLAESQTAIALLLGMTGLWVLTTRTKVMIAIAAADAMSVWPRSNPALMNASDTRIAANVSHSTRTKLRALR